MSSLTTFEDMPLEIFQQIARSSATANLSVAFILSQVSRSMNIKATAVLYEIACINALPSLALSESATLTVTGVHQATHVRHIRITGGWIHHHSVHQFFPYVLLNIAKHARSSQPLVSFHTHTASVDIASVFPAVDLGLPGFGEVSLRCSTHPHSERSYLHMMRNISGIHLTKLILDYTEGSCQPTYNALAETILEHVHSASNLNHIVLALSTNISGHPQTLQDVLDNEKVVFQKLHYLHFIAEDINISAAAFIHRQTSIKELRYITEFDYTDFLTSLLEHTTVPKLEVFSGLPSVVCLLCAPVRRPLRKITLEGGDMRDEMWCGVVDALSTADNLQELILCQGWGYDKSDFDRLYNATQKLESIEFVLTRTAERTTVECLFT
ncbi:hypothetical protein FB446DRAFT_794990 [Lentinula raphanica]|nr:hypothetical protein FB446DRAFT_794990 [Lentinula raphanica]